MCYQVEQQLKEFGDQIPANEKARAESLIHEVRQLVSANSGDLSRLRELTGDLQQLVHGMAATANNAKQSGDFDSTDYTGFKHPGGGDDVIDADYRETR